MCPEALGVGSCENAYPKTVPTGTYEVYVQNTKDSFYELLKSRLAALNPERTVVIRGVTRPALAVDENEAESVAAVPDCFHMSWTRMTTAVEGGIPLIGQLCEVRYATAGTSMNGGLDRGRALAAMDGELLAAVVQAPQSSVKNDFSALAQGGPVRTMSTRFWWSDPVFQPVTVNADRVSRVVFIEVVSFQEAGEL